MKKARKNKRRPPERGSKKGYHEGCFGNKKPVTPEPYKRPKTPQGGSIES